MKTNHLLLFFIMFFSAFQCYSQNCDNIELMQKLYDAINDRKSQEAIEIIEGNKGLVNCKFKESLFLWEAALTEQPEIVKCLLASGADIALYKKDQLLFLTIIENIYNKSILETIVKQASEKGLINATDQYVLNKGRTAFIVACARENKIAVENLLKYNCDVNLINEDGQNGLIAMMEYSGFGNEEDFLIEMIKLFIDKVDNIVLTDKKGMSAFDYASKNKQNKIMSFLRFEDTKRRNKDNPVMQDKIKQIENHRRR